MRSGEPRRLPFVRDVRSRARCRSDTRPRGAEGRHDPLHRPRRLDRARGGARPGGRPRDPLPLLLATPRRARAARRHRREVHRRRGDGRVRRAGRPRGRRRARRARGARDPGLDRRGAADPHRRQHRRGARRTRRAARRGRGRWSPATSSTRPRACRAPRRSNGILVGEATYRATRHAIEYREAPPVEAKGKSEPVKVWEAVDARSRFGSDVEQKLRTPLVGRRARARAYSPTRSTRARSRGVGPARHARRRPGDRQEPARRGALPDHRGRPRPHQLAAGPLSPLRRARQLLGARRDRQGARRDPRIRRHRGRGGEARRDGRGARRRTSASGSGSPGIRVRCVGLESGGAGRARGGIRRVASTARGGSRAATARARVRGSPLGRRRPARLRRPPRRLGDDRSAAHRRHGRPELLDRRPGWGGGKRNAFTLSLGALTERGDGRSSSSGCSTRRSSTPTPAGSAPACRGQPALRRGVRADARASTRTAICRCPRRCRA